jgi:hypothetical protein
VDQKHEFPSPAPVSAGEVDITRILQEQTINTYMSVTASLKPNLSEKAIAQAIIAELKAAGVTEFWYDIPILVLIGERRILQLAQTGYTQKKPQEEIILRENTLFFVDIHPRHSSGRWGNFAATGIYEPADDQVITFLKGLQHIQEECIKMLSPTMAGKDVAVWFQKKFQQQNIELLDVRRNFGHNMGFGPKNSYQRLFLDEHNPQPIGGQIWGIEPGGIHRHPSKSGVLIGRFEDCVHVPLNGSPSTLGRDSPIPITFTKR